MKKIIVLSIFAIFLAVPVLTLAQTSGTAQTLADTLKKQIENLMAQITALNAQLEQIKSAKREIKETAKEIKGTLQLIRDLKEGISGEDVKLLQQVLATDPEIYPEGLVTGYFGRLTAKAVKKFQLKMGVEQVGNVGPKTKSKINELLMEGAGGSGKVPPGLLIAPGIRKKIGFTPQPLPGQELPAGISKKINPTATSTPDTAAPVISGLQGKNITASSSVIAWTTNELSDSKVWYGASTPVTSASALRVSSGNKVLNHELALSGLNASTTYYYFVASADAAGNTSTSTEKSFITALQ